ncbi:MAG: mechanosensitive ion channel domain-containing protein [Bacteroidota bacterium]
MDWLTPENITVLVQEYLIPAVTALLLLFVVFIAAGWARRLVRKGLERANVDITLTKFFSNMARYAVLVVGIIAVLARVGIETASFAAILAAAGFAIGMAFQGTLSNFSAGIMLLVFRPFKVGDLVSVGGVTGVVDEIELFTTNLNTPDNRRIIVPNGSVFGATIENMTFHDTRRVDVAVGTDYSADLDETRRVIEAACSGVQGRISDLGVQAYLVSLGGSSIDWEARVWCNSADYLAVKDELTKAVKNGLDAANIGIPFPQTDVHIDGAILRSN